MPLSLRATEGLFTALSSNAPVNIAVRTIMTEASNARDPIYVLE